VTPAPLRRADLLRYGALALPLAFAGLPVYLHAPDFYTRHHGMPLATLGLVLLALRAVDAVQDPLIGALSDRFHRRRREILLGGMALMGGGFWMVFNPVDGHVVAWFALAVLACTTGFSIVAINFQALGGLWSCAPAERTRVTGWREAAGLVGLLLASAAPTILGVEEDADAAFGSLSLLYVPLLCVVAVVFFGWMARAEIAAPSAGSPGGPVEALRTGWNRRFFAIYLLNSFAGAIPAVLVVFFVRDRLDAGALTGLFLVLYFLSGAVSMPLWDAAARRVGKLQAWLASMLLATGTFVWAFLLGKGDVAAFGAVCVMSGLALGADLALPPAILADRIAKLKDQHAASGYFSVMTFLTKSGLALATGVTLPLLGWMGYQPGAVEDYSQTAHLSVAYALVPCALKAAVAAWLWRFANNNGEETNEKNIGGADGRVGIS